MVRIRNQHGSMRVLSRKSGDVFEYRYNRIRVDGKRVPVLEIVKRDKGVQDAIQTNNLHLLQGIIEASVGQGMHSFDQYLIELLAARQITKETATQYSVNKHRLDMVLRGIVGNIAILKPDEDR